MQTCKPSIRRLAFALRSLSAQKRMFHVAKADLVSIGTDGQPTTKSVSIWLGDPEDAFAVIPPEVSRIFTAQKVTSHKLGESKDKFRLLFHHADRSFATVSEPFPRLRLPQDMPKTGGPTSPATLYCFGVNHTIALDGTDDAIFAEHSMSSHKELKPVLDELASR